jgi:hypothetical protein
MPVDSVRGKTEPFECARGTRIAKAATRTKEFIDREREPFALLAFGRCDAEFRGIAIDAALHELGNEPGVADGFRSTVDEEPREELVVEKPVGFRGLDGRANFIFGISAPSETRPEL